MGWLYVHKEKSVTTKEFFQNIFGPELVDISVKGFNTVYCAIRNQDNTVTAIVILTDHRKDSYCNFGYKWMSEAENPYYHECPKKILNKLSPLTEHFKDPEDYRLATKWRTLCDRYHETKKTEQKLRPKLKTNNYYKTTAGLRFSSTTSITSGTTLKCIDAKRLIFMTPERELFKFSRKYTEYLTPTPTPDTIRKVN